MHKVIVFGGVSVLEGKGVCLLREVGVCLGREVEVSLEGRGSREGVCLGKKADPQEGRLPGWQTTSKVDPPPPGRQIPLGRHSPGGRQTPVRKTDPHLPPKKEENQGIRSMSGRYASYCNEFLYF